MRARELGIHIGKLKPGRLNAITDVAGVRVGHHTLNTEVAGKDVRTGVTVIEPRPGSARFEPCFAGCHVLNGNGDATGLEWIREAGLLTTSIAYTNTHSVGVVRDALIAVERKYAAQDKYWCMPVVLETFDGLLNDIWGQHITAEHLQLAHASARTGPVEEGSIGGGTGMICHEFKGGIGSASRVLDTEQGGWTVGALVQANYGKRQSLRIGGYPVSDHLDDLHSPFRNDGNSGESGMGSIVVTIATDAPLLPHQCTRLAQRASIGLARMGGGTEDSSGDIFIAFSVGNNSLPVARYGEIGEPTTTVRMVNNDHISNLFTAAADVVEEAIINALLAAKEIDGNGRRAIPLPHDRLLSALHKSGWKPSLS